MSGERDAANPRNAVSFFRPLIRRSFHLLASCWPECTSLLAIPGFVLPNGATRSFRSSPAEAGNQGPCPHGLSKLGPRFRGDERRMLLRPWSPIQLSKSRCDGVACKEAKENRPLLCRWARGSPSFLFFRLPRKSRGMARHKAHGLDFARPARECVAPGRARIAGLWA